MPPPPYKQQKMAHTRTWPAKAKCAVLQLMQSYRGDSSTNDEKETDLADQIRLILESAPNTVVNDSKDVLYCVIQSLKNEHMKKNLHDILRKYLKDNVLQNPNSNTQCSAQEASEYIATVAAQTKKKSSDYLSKASLIGGATGAIAGVAYAAQKHPHDHVMKIASGVAGGITGAGIGGIAGAAAMEFKQGAKQGEHKKQGSEEHSGMSWKDWLRRNREEREDRADKA